MDSQEFAGGVEKVSVVRITEGMRSNVEDLVAAESPLTIVLDNRELVYSAHL